MSAGTFTSPDGTDIAWERLGDGPPIVMIECVGVSRATSPQPTLPATLADHAAVHRFDRRGKGKSPAAAPYSLERELDDIAGILDVAGSEADVYGFSSGATLALLAAEAGLPIHRLVLLEPPLMPQADPDLSMRTKFERVLAEHGPAAAQRWFNVEIVGIPEDILATFGEPSQESLRDVPSIAHELTFLPGTPAERFAAVTQPTLIVTSDHTAPQLTDFASALAADMPAATHSTLPGGWHGVPDDVLVEAMMDFLRPDASPTERSL